MNCECDRFLHEPPKPPCTNPPEAIEGLIVSPALCTRCLWYCWNDEEA